MLNQILTFLNNFFEIKEEKGDFEIADSKIELPFVVDNQYFRIQGSIFNDGIYQYPASELTDETFSGTITAMAVPKDIISLTEEISAFVEKNSAKMYGLNSSESFEGASFTRKGDLSWQSIYNARLRPYQKL